MNLAVKVLVIIIACLLVAGAVCLAFGIMLDGSINDVFSAAAAEIANVLNTLFHIGTPQ